MLEITGEYISLDRKHPKPNRSQQLLSWLWPVSIRVKDHGADWVRYLTFETTYVLKRGKWARQHQKSRLISTEDLEEHRKKRNKEDGNNG